MEHESKKMNCIIVITRHALERAMQVGMDKEQLVFIFEQSARIRGNKRAYFEKFCNGKNIYRYYRNGANVFVAIKVRGKLRIVTVYDDVIVRDEYVKLNIDTVYTS